MEEKAIIPPDVLGSVNPMQGFYRLSPAKELVVGSYDVKGNIDGFKILDLKESVTAVNTSLGTAGTFEDQYEWPIFTVILQADTIDFNPPGIISGYRPDGEKADEFSLNCVVQISAGKNPNEVVFGVASIESITEQ
ncbi:MAG: hypothetical protein JWO03_2890 [Bacteroidetes bacterium]|nr:hypothetical protein [Bacteroidota bacterium]